MDVSISKLAKLVEGKIQGDQTQVVTGISPFDIALQGDIALAENKKYLKNLDQTKAGVLLVSEDAKIPETRSAISFIIVKNPRVAFAKLLAFFYPPELPEPGIDKDARLGNQVKTGNNVFIGPFAVIGDRVTIGEGTRIYSGTIIDDDVCIGDDTIIYPNVTIRHKCIIGNRVIIHSGSVIGSDGFGFAPDGEIYHKTPQIGTVQIDDDVEIGACNAIDRATFGKTWIKKGVKTDNLVQIAHNVVIGENTVIVAQVGISGSVTIGKNAVLAGQAGIAGHLTIGNKAIVGPQAGVGRSVPDGEIVSGSPEIAHKHWLRVQRVVPKLPDLTKKIKELEKRLTDLENLKK